MFLFLFCIMNNLKIYLIGITILLPSWFWELPGFRWTTFPVSCWVRQLCRSAEVQGEGTQASPLNEKCQWHIIRRACGMRYILRQLSLENNLQHHGREKRTTSQLRFLLLFSEVTCQSTSHKHVFPNNFYELIFFSLGQHKPFLFPKQ